MKDANRLLELSSADGFSYSASQGRSTTVTECPV
jgi:hypothetical protein